MAEISKVIRGLECCLSPNDHENCPYDGIGKTYSHCLKQLVTDALALLKEQEPRVMTLEELRDVGRVWESSTPPFLWLDKNRSIYNSIGFWCPWRDIYEMIHGRHDKYTDENYGSEWRCWNALPTPEKTRGTPWEGDSDGE